MDSSIKSEKSKTLTPLDSQQISSKHDKLIKSENININLNKNESTVNNGLVSPSSPDIDTINHNDISEGNNGINLANLNIRYV